METIDPSAVVVSTTGLISREVYERFHSDRCIYVPGSMGLVSSIGLGIALSVPDRLVVVIDGDASLLMNLGTLVTAGKQHPHNFLHIVLDNQAYGSCSEEASMSDSVDLSDLADISCYWSVSTVADEDDLRRAILETQVGPWFIHAHIELGGRRDFRRPTDLPQIKKRFMRFLACE